jgi:hypothetical protein
VNKQPADRKFNLILGRVGPPADKREMAEFNVETLFNDQLVIAVGSHNQLARHRKISLADLVDEP